MARRLAGLEPAPGLMTPPDPIAPVADTVEAATARGRAALAAGDRPEAQRWLGRAHRLQPDDPLIGLLLAAALGGHDDAGVRLLLSGLVAEHDWFRDLRIALLAAEHRMGNAAAAAATLDALLLACAPPDEPGFRGLADAVVRAAGVPGWLGLDAGGRLTLSPQAPGVRVRLDGRPVALPAGAGILTRRLPAGCVRAARLTAELDGRSLLGSGLDPAARSRVEGVVDASEAGGLEGWAWHPADPDRPATLLVQAEDAPPGTGLRLRATIARSGRPGTSPRGFRVAPGDLPGDEVLHVTGPDGRALSGSPLRPGAERAAARVAAAALGHPGAAAADPWRPLPVLPFVARGGVVPARRPVDVVVPIHRGAADFLACLAGLRRDLPAGTRLVVVDDAAPERALREAAEAAGEVVLLGHETSRGFPASANVGLRHALQAPDGPRDVVLLNPDTLLPRGWLARLLAAAYAAADVASATPLTGDGTILSVPHAADAEPDQAGTERLDALARVANGARVVDLPTGVGFCMAIRHDALAEVGLLREDAFAQGYGEENDWCLRARALGWRHVAATGVFVAHLGGRSFGHAKEHLLARNLAVLNRLHPGYDALVARFLAADPLAPARARMDALRWRRGRRAGAVVLVTHDLGGGVARHLEERCEALRGQGLRAIVLRPAAGEAAAGGVCVLSDGPGRSHPDLRFTLPAELARLCALLRGDRPQRVELHHLLGHAPEAASLGRMLGIPTDVVVHDYALWCPRVTLCSHGHRYCGEPLDVATCEACIADLGRRTPEAIPVAEHRRRSAALLGQARQVLAPSRDTAERLARQFPGIRPVVTPWGPDPDAPSLPRPGPGSVRAVVCGAIGPEKGLDVLLACAREAARAGTELRFVLVGHSSDDARLIEAGVFVTGRYEEGEATALLQAQHGHVGFLPSLWPETWCYALGELWSAGLAVAAFDLGAPAERIRRTGRGTLLPLGLGAARINAALLALARGPAK